MATAQGLRYSIAKSKIRVPLVWYRHRAISSADVFVGAYPRSGSTWLRFLLLEVLSGQCAEFDSVNTLVPSVGEHRGSPTLLPAGGRLIKTHENYRPEYRKAVYLVRDARDVLLSEYAYQKAKGWFESDFDSYLLAFLKGKVNAYGSWQEHVGDWTQAASRSANILVLRYEPLRQNTVAELEKVFRFIGVGVSRQQLQQAVDSNSLERMKAKEDKSQQLRQDRFVRSGSVRGWEGKLTVAQLQLIDRYAGPALAALGYPPGSAPAAPPSAELSSQFAS
jgi:hypothetical protein